jgi:4-hydroxy-2-oxoheptanedioate aldolase
LARTTCSCNLGLPEEWSHPRFEEAIQTIIAKARAHGVGAGRTLSGNRERVALGKGGSQPDRPFGRHWPFADTLRADLTRFREECGETGPRLTTTYE